MRYRPGQHAWLTLGDTPFSLQQHPFSISSGNHDPRRLEFTIKQSGDFTGYVDADLLERILQPDADDIDYFICGPDPMMDQVERALRQRGAALRRLYSERFNLV